MTTRRPRAREKLTRSEAASLIAHASRVGGWRALAREWQELNDTTMRRAARRDPITPLVLHSIRERLNTPKIVMEGCDSA